MINNNLMCNCYEKLILPLIGQFGHCTTLRHLLLIKNVITSLFSLSVSSKSSNRQTSLLLTHCFFSFIYKTNKQARQNKTNHTNSLSSLGWWLIFVYLRSLKGQMKRKGKKKEKHKVCVQAKLERIALR